MLQRIGNVVIARRYCRLLVTVALAVATVAGTAVTVNAQWPTGCVELNDIVEQHLGNVGNVGIYQRIHGDQAEAACRTDHRADVQTTFAWAFVSSTAAPGATAAPAAPSTSQFAGGWPTTCVYLNDVVEAHLGNDRNVGIYTRSFGDQAEARCQQDHTEDVRRTFAWVGLCEAATVARAARPGYIRAFDAAGPTVGDLAASNRQLERLLLVMPWLRCFTYPWLIDGISAPDQMALNGLLLTDTINRDLAISVASSDWFADGTNSVDPYSGEMYALQYIQQIAQKSDQLSDLLRSFAWLADDITSDETIALRNFNDMVERDLQFALDVASAPWVKDGLVSYEEAALGDLLSMHSLDPGLAKQLLANTLHTPVRSSDVRVITALQELVTDTDAEGKRTSRYHRLANTSWFTDGLDVRERALINALNMVYVNDDKFFDRLLASHHYRSLAFSIPMAGPFTIWAFSDRPIPEDLHLLSRVAQGLHGAERIVQSPLPFNDIVILLAGEHAMYRTREVSPPFTEVVVMAPWEILVNQDGLILIQATRTHLINQTVASLYFTERVGPNYPYYEYPDPRWKLFDPKWFAYSAPEFINAYTDDWQGSRSLPNYNHEWATEARSKCADRGLTNIHALTSQTEPTLYSRGEPLRRCADLYGRQLLFLLFTTLGEERMSSAMRDLYLLSERSGWRTNAEGIVFPSEKDIYRTFLRYTPPHLYDEVRHWYNHLHGGPFVHEVAPA